MQRVAHLTGGAKRQAWTHCPRVSARRFLRALVAGSGVLVISAGGPVIDSRVGTAKTRRARRAHMSPAEFIGLVAGWSGGLAVLSFISDPDRLPTYSLSYQPKAFFRLGKFEGDGTCITIGRGPFNEHQF